MFSLDVWSLLIVSAFDPWERFSCPVRCRAVWGQGAEWAGGLSGPEEAGRPTAAEQQDPAGNSEPDGRRERVQPMEVACGSAG